MKKLVIDTQALAKNIALVKDRAKSAVIYATLTADALGTGLVPMANRLRDAGIQRFAVDRAEDAAALRKNGFVDEELLMLRSTTDEHELETLIDLNVVCTIGSHEAGVALNALAESRSTVVEAHILLDCGLGFGGLLTDELEQILSMYRYLPNVAISGTCAHIYAGKDKQTSLAQLKRFQEALSAIQDQGFETGIVYVAGSTLFLGGQLGEMDGVLVSSALYGRGRPVKGARLSTISYGQASLEGVRWLPKGSTVGIDTLTTLKKPTRVAVLPVGHQNGFGISHPREGGLLSTISAWMERRRTYRFVTVDGQKVPILGAIGPRETLLDITEFKCTSGDCATFPLDALYAHGLPREYQ